MAFLSSYLVFVLLAKVVGALWGKRNDPLPTTPPVASGPDLDIISVPLGKQYVPVKKGNRTVAHKTAYFGTVHAGYPVAQNFTVVFDTGSGHFILPSTTCTSDACTAHRRYDRDQSESAVDIEHDGSLVEPTATERTQVAIAFGTGEVTGEFVEETVCLRERTTQRSGLSAGNALANRQEDGCVRLRVALAVEMTDDPFRLFSFDGVMGLGLDRLVLSPEFSFFGRMVGDNPKMLPIFAVYLSQGDSEDSEISFGGHNPSRLLADSKLSWTHVAAPELGYWQVQIKSVRVGDTVIQACEDGACRAILDTGTSLLGVPKAQAKTLHWLLAREVVRYTPDLDCRHFPGPSIVFDLGDFTVQLDAEDYSRPAAALMRKEEYHGQEAVDAQDTAVFCRSSLLPIDMQEPLGSKVFIWGEPVLRRYYTAYNWVTKQIGFGDAMHEKQASVAAGRVPDQGGNGGGTRVVSSQVVQI